MASSPRFQTTFADNPEWPHVVPEKGIGQPLFRGGGALCFDNLAYFPTAGAAVRSCLQRLTD
jgi:hypothetical protein